MPYSMKYEVNTRYTSTNALVQKLQKIFPDSMASDFEVKVKLSSNYSIFLRDIADK